MAVAADYSGWVRELDEYQSNNDGQYDERLEAAGPDNGKNSKGALSSRAGGNGAVNTSRKLKPRGTSAASAAPISQAEELQQEMKLLNWHKLANEAALKAAIIKTNKIKQEDTQFASALTQGEREERAQRAQQIIEEEQLKPLQVNSEFFRNLDAKGQRDEAKLDDDVQRHIQHLRKLKESMTQREDMQRRRQQYREKMRELQANGNATSRSKMQAKGSNQDEEAAPPDKHDRGNSNSVYHRAAMAAGGKTALDNANVVTSLDKLMELEQRIRHLEDAGLAVDDLDDARDGNTSSRTAGPKQSAANGLRFAKRRTTGGLHEPSKTVYAVTGATKMRARDKTTVSSSRRAQGATAAANAKKRALNSSNTGGARNRTKSKNDTFLTSLPESKQRQLRRMTERERRNFLKNEKAKEAREQSHKQDVVIEGWLEKKRAAANQRKAATSQVRAGAAAATKSSTAASARNPKQRLPPQPRVRAPTLGAASGKRIANPHLQKLDDIKKGFTKRKEAFQRLPPTSSRPSGRFNATTATATASRNQRSFARSAVIGANTRQTASTAQRYGASSLPPARSAASAARVPAAGPTRQAPGQRANLAVGPASGHITNKLPLIQRNTAPPSALPGAARRPGGPGKVVGTSTALPRLAAPQSHARAGTMPSPPPAARSANMPTFSRLHKR